MFMMTRNDGVERRQGHGAGASHAAITEASFVTNKSFAIAAGLTLFLLLAIPALAAERQVLHDHVPDAVAKLNLQPVGRPSATNILHLGISLPLRNNEALGELFKEIQDPASPNFRHYLTPAQFNEKFGPTEADFKAVVNFARANGLTVKHTNPGRTLVSVEGTVADVEKTLHLTLRLYQHPTEARQFFAPDVEPSLDLAVPILAISGLNDYELLHSKAHAADKRGAAKYGGGSYDPNGEQLLMGYDFRHAYAYGTELDGSGQVVGLLEEQGYNTNDILAYEATAGLPNVPVQEVLVDGYPHVPSYNGDGEASLDIEMAISMAPGLQKVVFYYFYYNDLDGVLTSMADPTNGEPMPLQISSSYGSGTDGGTSNCCLRLAVQGQSYFYAMGDEAALPVDPNGPQGTYINGASAADLQPYMTQVGGTELYMTNVGAYWVNETVWGDSGPTGGPNGSSGGILTPIPIPAYQQWINMSANGGSSNKCNVPDVAAAADGVLDVFTDSKGVRLFQDEDGTSCAAPLWAGFMALVNQQAAEQGKPPIGFATPALYSIAEGPLYTSCFHDITNGNNTWSNSPNRYYAQPGYDLCTGLGSPGGIDLINALVDYAGPIWVNFAADCPGTGGYYSPYCTLASGISKVAAGGTVCLVGPNSSSATITINKPLTLRAFYGPVTIGK
jgi:subtilase family serine protease